MPRPKKTPLPDVMAHNLRKRAEKMEAIARTLELLGTRAALQRKADHLRKLADDADRGMIGTTSCKSA